MRAAAGHNHWKIWRAAMSNALKVIIVIILLAVAYTKYIDPPNASSMEAYETDGDLNEISGRGSETIKSSTHYSCDGRIRCSQMTSCAEAKFFLEHCPGTKMDGDGDGVPCENQWCN
jgi:hypothetical protein